MKLAIRNIRHIILLMMVTAFSLEMSAQWNFDIGSGGGLQGTERGFGQVHKGF